MTESRTFFNSPPSHALVSIHDCSGQKPYYHYISMVKIDDIANHVLEITDFPTPVTLVLDPQPASFFEEAGVLVTWEGDTNEVVLLSNADAPPTSINFAVIKTGLISYVLGLSTNEGKETPVDVLKALGKAKLDVSRRATGKKRSSSILAKLMDSYTVIMLDFPRKAAPDANEATIDDLDELAHRMLAPFILATA